MALRFRDVTFVQWIVSFSIVALIVFAVDEGLGLVKGYGAWVRENMELETETERYVAAKAYDAAVYRANADFNKHEMWVKLVHHLAERFAPTSGLERLERGFGK